MTEKLVCKQKCLPPTMHLKSNLNPKSSPLWSEWKETWTDWPEDVKLGGIVEPQNIELLEEETSKIWTLSILEKKIHQSVLSTCFYWTLHIMPVELWII